MKCLNDKAIYTYLALFRFDIVWENFTALLILERMYPLVSVPSNNDNFGSNDLRIYQLGIPKD